MRATIEQLEDWKLRLMQMVAEMEEVFGEPERGCDPERIEMAVKTAHYIAVREWERKEERAHYSF
jgi:hypothetical protein